MRIFTCCALCLIIIVACKKETLQPATAAGAPATSTDDTTKEGNYPSKIRMFVNDTRVAVTSINYNRSSGTFDFSAENKLQKVDAKCFHFYQQSRWNFQYSDSIAYATRPDTLTEWTTYSATNGGDVTFDCCDAPLTDSLVEGEYSGSFFTDKKNIVVRGDFHLIF